MDNRQNWPYCRKEEVREETGKRVSKEERNRGSRNGREEELKEERGKGERKDERKRERRKGRE
jgi:hypothetical protein